MFSKYSSLLSRMASINLKQVSRGLNLLEYQSKGLLEDNNVLVQRFRVASEKADGPKIASEFPCKEYVVKAQVLAGGRGKGHFDNGFKGKRP